MPTNRDPASIANSAPSAVRVVRNTDGTYTLQRNGEPYVVKGAGGHRYLRLLAESGGNAIRTWSTDPLEQVIEGKPFLDYAHDLGISVTAGFWVGHERHGFDYSDPAAIEVQRAALRTAVLKYRDHPALLSWGLGNEMEGFERGKVNVQIWKELNHLAGMIKELDPHHPVMTVIAGAPKFKIDGILEHYPNLDILGVNSYAGAPTVGRSLLESGWDGPYMLTEFGVTGTWESPSTPWGAPIEQDPSAKSAQYYATYKMNAEDNVGRSLGSFAFYWANKQEATATWFGMFLPTGEKLPPVDAMAFAWSGKWPENRAPKLISLKTPIAFETVAAGSRTYAEVDCLDREGDDLRYVWDIRAESSDRRIGGDAEAAPPSFPEVIEEGQGTARITFTAPSQPGGYRVFITVYDGEGGAVGHNLPFYVNN